MFSNKSYELPITKDYIAHWGMLDGVREIVQNALDSESPFEWEFDGDVFRVHSKHSVLEPSTLLLGATTKAENVSQIGAFGEGYKLALLVLCRAGYAVRIINNGLVWAPEFRFSNKYSSEILYVVEKTSGRKSPGVTFEIAGLTHDDMAAVRLSCLQMQETIGEVKDTSMGQILLEQQGRLYVGGLYICETDLKHGYNIKPEYVTLERDRRTVDGFDLKMVTKQMWFETQDYDRICNLIENEVPDVEHARYSAPEVVKEAAYRHFRKEHPKAVMARDQQELEELVREGCKVYVGGSTYHSVVTSAPSYKNEKRTGKILPEPHQYLRKWFQDNRQHLKPEGRILFKQLINYSKKWGIGL